MEKSKFWLRGIPIASLIVGIVILISESGLLDRFEWQTLDWRSHILRADSKLPSDIAVILVDDASLKAMDPIAGRWPWPRSVHADLIEFLGYANPKAVLFDIDFWEKQRITGLQGEFISPHDQRLVEATTEFPFVYHAAGFALDTLDSGSNRTLPYDFIQRFALEKKYTLSSFSDRPNNTFQIPFPELHRAAKGIGVVNMSPDEDGVFRRARLWHQFGENRFASLGFAPVLNQIAPEKLEKLGSVLKLRDRELPLDSNENFIVNYYGDYTGYSYSGILASLQAIRRGEFDQLIVNPEEFVDKIIFVGVSAAGLNDLKNTPLNPNLPGVYIHATIAGNILSKDFLTPLPQWTNVAATILLGILTVFGVLGTTRLFFQIGVPILAFGGYFGMSFVTQKIGYILPVVAPGLSAFFSLTGTLALLVLTEGREKRKIKKMMSQYLSPAVLESVVNNPTDLMRAEVGFSENLTILFSDIRGFTSMSEVLPAEKVVEILNHYLSEMTDIIFKHEGTVDKFIGDAIMAFWGAPIRIQNHADKAVHSALEMIHRLNDVNQWLTERDYPNLEVGIGLNSGNVVLGNIGSEHKLEYTIIGDNVNLASRMEGLTKQYGCALLISESTYRALTEPIPCRLIDLVRVKGKKMPVKIYQPLLAATASVTNLNEVIKCHEDFFSFYLSKRWNDAMDLLTAMPDDAFKRLMTDRCRYFQKSPPDDAWDGVYTLTSK